jgi:hypothetical protein
MGNADASYCLWKNREVFMKKVMAGIVSLLLVACVTNSEKSRSSQYDGIYVTNRDSILIKIEGDRWYATYNRVNAEYKLAGSYDSVSVVKDTNRVLDVDVAYHTENVQLKLGTLSRNVAGENIPMEIAEAVSLFKFREGRGVIYGAFSYHRNTIVQRPAEPPYIGYTYQYIDVNKLP